MPSETDPDNLSRNPFDCLCELASKERWCWNIFCRTCRHINFRYALHEIARGKHPAGNDWLIHADNPYLKRGSAVQGLGPVPLRQSWSLEEQASLVHAIQHADISNIASSCSYPDWLGYLGLALYYANDAERRDRKLTQSWGPQLMDMTSQSSRAARKLTAACTSVERRLNWEVLEALEFDDMDLLG